MKALESQNKKVSLLVYLDVVDLSISNDIIGYYLYYL